MRKVKVSVTDDQGVLLDIVELELDDDQRRIDLTPREVDGPEDLRVTETLVLPCMK